MHDRIWEQLATHSAEIDVLTSAHAATNSKVKELEAAVTTALKYLAAGSQEHQALEQRLAETQLLVQQRSWSKSPPRSSRDAGLLHQSTD